MSEWVADWTVVRSWSFDDASARCGFRVRNWIPVVPSYARPHQSGCLMSLFLLNRPVTVLLQPSNCMTRRDCGDRSVDNHPMDCCPDRSCAVRRSDGSSSCQLPLPKKSVSQQTEGRVSGCKSPALRKCLSFRNVCSQEYVGDLKFGR